LAEDHVGSLLLFDQGMPIGDEGRNWLMIHLANCFDERHGDATISKHLWDVRVDWTAQNIKEIVRTARNPEDTADWWRNADKPFSFVAACMEWVAATDQGYGTRLPITLDATCNGVQHLSALSRAKAAGFLSNLTDADPQDVYRHILDKVIERLGAEQGNMSSARFWLAEKRLNRKIVKRPAATFGYSVTP